MAMSRIPLRNSKRPCIVTEAARRLKTKEMSPPPLFGWKHLVSVLVEALGSIRNACCEYGPLTNRTIAQFFGKTEERWASKVLFVGCGLLSCSSEPFLGH